MLPLLAPLAEDTEPLVRQHLAEQLAGVAAVCAGGGEVGYAALLDSVLPTLGRLLGDGVVEVRVAAGEALVSAAARVRPADLGPRLLTLVLELAHREDAEDLRMTAAVLLNELAPALGPELAGQFLVPEAVNLAEDPVYRVRCAAALNFDAVCRTAGPAAAAARLIPAFALLAVDHVWGVRKACAEAIVAVSGTLEPGARLTLLAPLMERFVADTSKWVRSVALGQLGPFLWTLSSSGKPLPPGLVATYLRAGLAATGGGAEGAVAAAGTAAPAAATAGAAAKSGGATARPAAAPAATASGAAAAALARPGTDSSDADLAVLYAFSLPAVAAAMGRARWPELRPLFHALARDVQKRVRRPVAASLHELARIVGPDLAEADFLPVAEAYLRDVEEVRAACVPARLPTPHASSLPPPPFVNTGAHGRPAQPRRAARRALARVSRG